VVQVLARGSIDGGEWGEYDTSTIDKTMRVVVSLEYAVRCANGRGGRRAPAARPGGHRTSMASPKL
jgi:hypothetical protein